MRTQSLFGIFILFVFSNSSFATKVKPSSVQSGEAVIQGAVAATRAEAELAWDAVCTQWREQIEQQHPVGSLIMVNCGNPGCPALSQTQVQCTADGYFKYDDSLLPEGSRPGKKVRSNSKHAVK